MQKTPIKLSCGDCGHSGVCKVSPNVQSMLQSLFPEGTKPVCQPEDFANICNAFIGKSRLQPADEYQTIEEAPTL